MSSPSFTASDGAEHPTEQVHLHQCEGIKLSNCAATNFFGAAHSKLHLLHTVDGNDILNYYDTTCLAAEKARVHADAYDLVHIQVRPTADAVDRVMVIIFNHAGILAGDDWPTMCYKASTIKDDSLSAEEAEALVWRRADFFNLHIPGPINMADSAWMRRITLGQLATGSYGLMNMDYYYNHSYSVGHSVLLHAIKEKAVQLGRIPTDDRPDDFDGFVAAAVVDVFAAYGFCEPALRVWTARDVRRASQMHEEVATLVAPVDGNSATLKKRVPGMCMAALPASRDLISNTPSAAGLQQILGAIQLVASGMLSPQWASTDRLFTFPGMVFFEQRLKTFHAQILFEEVQGLDVTGRGAAIINVINAQYASGGVGGGGGGAAGQGGGGGGGPTPPPGAAPQDAAAATGNRPPGWSSRVVTAAQTNPSAMVLYALKKYIRRKDHKPTVVIQILFLGVNSDGSYNVSFAPEKSSGLCHAIAWGRIDPCIIDVELAPVKLYCLQYMGRYLGEAIALRFVQLGGATEEQMRGLRLEALARALRKDGASWGDGLDLTNDLLLATNDHQHHSGSSRTKSRPVPKGEVYADPLINSRLPRFVSTLCEAINQQPTGRGSLRTVIENSNAAVANACSATAALQMKGMQSVNRLIKGCQGEWGERMEHCRGGGNPFAPLDLTALPLDEDHGHRFDFQREMSRFASFTDNRHNMELFMDLMDGAEPFQPSMDGFAAARANRQPADRSKRKRSSSAPPGAQRQPSRNDPVPRRPLEQQQRANTTESLSDRYRGAKATFKNDSSELCIGPSHFDAAAARAKWGPGKCVVYHCAEGCMRGLGADLCPLLGQGEHKDGGSAHTLGPNDPPASAFNMKKQAKLAGQGGGKGKGGPPGKGKGKGQPGRGAGGQSVGKGSQQGRGGGKGGKGKGARAPSTGLAAGTRGPSGGRGGRRNSRTRGQRSGGNQSGPQRAMGGVAGPRDPPAARPSQRPPSWNLPVGAPPPGSSYIIRPTPGSRAPDISPEEYQRLRLWRSLQYQSRPVQLQREAQERQELVHKQMLRMEALASADGWVWRLEAEKGLAHRLAHKHALEASNMKERLELAERQAKPRKELLELLVPSKRVRFGVQSGGQHRGPSPCNTGLHAGGAKHRGRQLESPASEAQDVLCDLDALAIVSAAWDRIPVASTEEVYAALFDESAAFGTVGDSTGMVPVECGGAGQCAFGSMGDIIFKMGLDVRVSSQAFRTKVVERMATAEFQSRSMCQHFGMTLGEFMSIKAEDRRAKPKDGNPKKQKAKLGGGTPKEYCQQMSVGSTWADEAVYFAVADIYNAYVVAFCARSGGQLGIPVVVDPWWRGGQKNVITIASEIGVHVRSLVRCPDGLGPRFALPLQQKAAETSPQSEARDSGRPLKSKGLAPRLLASEERDRNAIVLAALQDKMDSSTRDEASVLSGRYQEEVAALAAFKAQHVADEEARRREFQEQMSLQLKAILLVDSRPHGATVQPRDASEPMQTATNGTCDQAMWMQQRLLLEQYKTRQSGGALAVCGAARPKVDPSPTLGEMLGAGKTQTPETTRAGPADRALDMQVESVPSTMAILAKAEQSENRRQEEEVREAIRASMRDEEARQRESARLERAEHERALLDVQMLEAQELALKKAELRRQEAELIALCGEREREGGPGLCGEHARDLRALDAVEISARALIDADFKARQDSVPGKDKDWALLKDYERWSAGQLGWVQDTWDEGDDPPEPANCVWDKLPPHMQSAARALGWDKMIWDFDLTLTSEPPEVYAAVVATSLEALRCGQAAPPASTAVNAWTRLAFELTRGSAEDTKAAAKATQIGKRVLSRLAAGGVEQHVVDACAEDLGYLDPRLLQREDFALKLCLRRMGIPEPFPGHRPSPSLSASVVPRPEKEERDTGGRTLSRAVPIPVQVTLFSELTSERCGKALFVLEGTPTGVFDYHKDSVRDVFKRLVEKAGWGRRGSHRMFTPSGRPIHDLDQSLREANKDRPGMSAQDKGLWFEVRPNCAAGTTSSHDMPASGRRLPAAGLQCGSGRGDSRSSRRSMRSVGRWAVAGHPLASDPCITYRGWYGPCECDGPGCRCQPVTLDGQTALSEWDNMQRERPPRDYVHAWLAARSFSLESEERRLDRSLRQERLEAVSLLMAIQQTAQDKLDKDREELALRVALEDSGQESFWSQLPAALHALRDALALRHLLHPHFKWLRDWRLGEEQRAAETWGLLPTDLVSKIVVMSLGKDAGCWCPARADRPEACALLDALDFARARQPTRATTSTGGGAGDEMGAQALRPRGRGLRRARGRGTGVPIRRRAAAGEKKQKPARMFVGLRKGFFLAGAKAGALATRKSATGQRPLERPALCPVPSATSQEPAPDVGVHELAPNPTERRTYEDLCSHRCDGLALQVHRWFKAQHEDVGMAFGPRSAQSLLENPQPTIREMLGDAHRQLQEAGVAMQHCLTWFSGVSQETLEARFVWQRLPLETLEMLVQFSQDVRAWLASGSAVSEAVDADDWSHPMPISRRVQSWWIVHYMQAAAGDQDVLKAGGRRSQCQRISGPFFEVRPPPSKNDFWERCMEEWPPAAMGLPVFTVSVDFSEYFHRILAAPTQSHSVGRSAGAPIFSGLHCGGDSGAAGARNARLRAAMHACSVEYKRTEAAGTLSKELDATLQQAATDIGLQRGNGHQRHRKASIRNVRAVLLFEGLPGEWLDLASCASATGVTTSGIKKNHAALVAALTQTALVQQQAGQGASGSSSVAQPPAAAAQTGTGALQMLSDSAASRPREAECGNAAARQEDPPPSPPHEEQLPQARATDRASSLVNALIAQFGQLSIANAGKRKMSPGSGGTWSERPLADDELVFVEGPTDRSRWRVAQYTSQQRGSKERKTEDHTMRGESPFLARHGVKGAGLITIKDRTGPRRGRLASKAGETVGRYTGNVVVGPCARSAAYEQQCAEYERAGASEHLIHLKQRQGWCLVDGSEARPPFVPSANDSRCRKTNNSRIEESGLLRVTKDVAGADIKSATCLQDLAKSELLVPYGAAYWKHFFAQGKLAASDEKPGPAAAVDPGSGPPRAGPDGGWRVRSLIHRASKAIRKRRAAQKQREVKSMTLGAAPSTSKELPWTGLTAGADRGPPFADSTPSPLGPCQACGRQCRKRASNLGDGHFCGGCLPAWPFPVPPADNHTGGRILHMFAGMHGFMKRAATEVGVECDEVDDAIDGTDMCEERNQSDYLGRIASGEWGGIAMGPPCSSYSPALGSDGDSVILRSREHPDGLPGLTGANLDKLRCHNVLTSFTAEAAKAQIASGGELLIENPPDRGDPDSEAYWQERDHMPSMWATSFMRTLAEYAERAGRPLTQIEFPQCAMGPGPAGLYQKRTALWVTPLTAARLGWLSSLKCTHKAGEHKLARGYTEDGLSQAAGAATYPYLMCQHLVYGLTGATRPRARKRGAMEVTSTLEMLVPSAPRLATDSIPGQPQPQATFPTKARRIGFDGATDPATNPVDPSPLFSLGARSPGALEKEAEANTAIADFMASGNTPLWRAMPLPDLAPHAVVPADSPAVFCNGSAVRVEGLRSNTELNGLVGTVRNFNTLYERYSIKLGGGRILAVKPENLIAAIDVCAEGASPPGPSWAGAGQTLHAGDAAARPGKRGSEARSAPSVSVFGQAAPSTPGSTHGGLTISDELFGSSRPAGGPTGSESAEHTDPAEPSSPALPPAPKKSKPGQWPKPQAHPPSPPSKYDLPPPGNPHKEFGYVRLDQTDGTQFRACITFGSPLYTDVDGSYYTPTGGPLHTVEVGRHTALGFPFRIGESGRNGQRRSRALSAYKAVLDGDWTDPARLRQIATDADISAVPAFCSEAILMELRKHQQRLSGLLRRGISLRLESSAPPLLCHAHALGDWLMDQEQADSGVVLDAGSELGWDKIKEISDRTRLPGEPLAWKEQLPEQSVRAAEEADKAHCAGELAAGDYVVMRDAASLELVEDLRNKAISLDPGQLKPTSAQGDEKTQGKRRQFRLGASALAAACYTFGEKILARAGLAATNLQPASLLVTTAGAARQKWHRDTDADETYSMLLAVTDRQFHVDGIQETVHLEPGDVILFKAQLRHAGAGLDKNDQCFDAGRHGLVSIGMHMYAGKGLIPSEHTCFSYDVGDNKPMRISESFDYRDADAPDVTAATILMPTRLVQPNGLEDNPESLEGPPSDVEVFMPVNPNRLTGKLHRESGLKRSREAATKDAASWLPGLRVPAEGHFMAGEIECRPCTADGSTTRIEVVVAPSTGLHAGSHAGRTTHSVAGKDRLTGGADVMRALEELFLFQSCELLQTHSKAEELLCRSRLRMQGLRQSWEHERSQAQRARRVVKAWEQDSARQDEDLRERDHHNLDRMEAHLEAIMARQRDHMRRETEQMEAWQQQRRDKWLDVELHLSAEAAQSTVGPAEQLRAQGASKDAAPPQASAPAPGSDAPQPAPPSTGLTAGAAQGDTGQERGPQLPHHQRGQQVLRLRLRLSHPSGAMAAEHPPAVGEQPGLPAGGPHAQAPGPYAATVSAEDLASLSARLGPLLDALLRFERWDDLTSKKVRRRLEARERLAEGSLDPYKHSIKVAIDRAMVRKVLADRGATANARVRFHGGGTTAAAAATGTAPQAATQTTPAPPLATGGPADTASTAAHPEPDTGPRRFFVVESAPQAAPHHNVFEARRVYGPFDATLAGAQERISQARNGATRALSDAAPGGTTGSRPRRRPPSTGLNAGSHHSTSDRATRLVEGSLEPLVEGILRARPLERLTLRTVVRALESNEGLAEGALWPHRRAVRAALDASITRILAEQEATDAAQAAAAAEQTPSGDPRPPGSPAQATEGQAMDVAQDASPEDAEREPQGTEGAWFKLRTLSDRAYLGGADEARHRAAALTVAQLDSQRRPTRMLPEDVRTGARNAKAARLRDAPVRPASAQLSYLIQKQNIANAALKKALETGEWASPELDAIRRTNLSTFVPEEVREWAKQFADQLKVDCANGIPDALKDIILPEWPADILIRPLTTRTEVVDTPVRAQKVEEAPELNGWYPNDISDILYPEAIEGINEWTRLCREWHAAGGPRNSRPPARAWGVECVRPRARGRRWDLTGGPGKIKEWQGALSDEEAEAHTCLNLDFAYHLFEADGDCKDKEMIDFLLQGVRFHADQSEDFASTVIFLSPNLLSLYSQQGGIEAAAEQAADMVSQGFISVHAELPSVPCRLIPRGLVEKVGTEEKRGVGDQGAPRKLTTTEDTGVPVKSLNETCKADKGWAPEAKDSIETAAANGAVLLGMAHAAGLPVFTISFDFSKYFHRLWYNHRELYQMGAMVPGEDGGLMFGLERVLTMGARPASQIAQRFGNMIIQQLCRLMDKEEASLGFEPSLAEIMRARAHLAHDCNGTQQKAYNCLIYSDDLQITCISIDRTLRLLRLFYEVVGPGGLNVPLSRPSKQQIGTSAKWLGCMHAPGLGLVWLPPDKATKATASLRMALDGKMVVRDYRRLMGFLVSIKFMIGGDDTLLHHIFRPVNPGHEIDGGPETVVRVDAHMRPILERWLKAINNCPGAPAVAALVPTQPQPGARWHRIQTDASLQGTPTPGLGGFYFGKWWSVAIADTPGLERWDIPHLEFAAAAIGLLTFAPLLEGAERIELQTDALATAVALTHKARSPKLQSMLDILMDMTEYKELAPRLYCSHIAGCLNWASDCASRGYFDQLRSTCQAIGIDHERIPISPAAVRFLTASLNAMAAFTFNQEQQLAAPNPPADTDPMGAPPTEPSDPATAQEVSQQAPFTGLTAGAGGPSLSPSPSKPVWRPAGRTPMHEVPAARPAVRHTPPSRSPPADLKRARVSSPAQAQGAAQHPASGGRSAERAARAARAAAVRNREEAGSSPRHPPAATTSPAPIRATRYRALFAEDDARQAASKAAVLVGSIRMHGGLIKAPPPSTGAAATAVLRTAKEELHKQMVERLRKDASVYAIGAEQEVLEWMCDCSMVDEAELPENTKKQLSSNWKAWSTCAAALNFAPWRPDAAGLDAMGAERENVIWASAMVWIWGRMQPKKGNYLKHGPFKGQLCPPKITSALAVCRGVRRMHMDRGVTPAPLVLAARRAKAVMRTYAEWIGPENCVPKRKAPMTRRLILALLAVPSDTPVLPKGKLWDWTTPYGKSCRAAFHTLAQTGFRKAEIARPRGAKWSNMHISFANLTWRIRGEEVYAPSVRQLMALQDGDYAVITPPPSKADPLGLRWHGHPIWLCFDASSQINAARELARWELAAKVEESERRSTPLFRGDTGEGSCLRQESLDELLHGLLRWILPADGQLVPNDYSIHSFRAYLCSALMASGRSDGEIQAALRWSSPASLQVYKITNAEQYASWLRAAEATELTGRRAVQAPRPHPQHDHLAAAHAWRESSQNFIAAAIRADRDTRDAPAPEAEDLEVDYDPDASF